MPSSKTVTSTATEPKDGPSLEDEQQAKLKAEARAYALGSSSTSRGSKRKSAVLPAAVAKPTSLLIRRPDDRPAKMQKMEASSVSHSSSSDLNMASLETDDEYVRFVKSLGLDDSLFGALDNDDEDFHLSDIDEEDDDDEDDEDEDDDVNMLLPKTGLSTAKGFQDEDATPPLSSPLSASPVTLPDFDTDIHADLEEELGSLLEEDMEAAVQSLMTSKTPPAPAPGNKHHNKAPTKPLDKNQSAQKESPATPLRETARQGTRAQVTYKQSQQLRRLLTKHYQTLVQQAVLAVRAAQVQKLNKDKSDFMSGETADDLAEILDGAVGMLQDLDQNRKDAIRNCMQLTQTLPSTGSTPKGRRSLLSKFQESTAEEPNPKVRPLTRAAFSKSLQEHSAVGRGRTAFDIPGLTKLGDTFLTIDKSVDGVEGAVNILQTPTHAEACKLVLRQASARVDDSIVPGTADLSENFCDVKEVFGPSFEPPCKEDEQAFLRRNRNLFTSGEDNLVLRGVNLYGEKQWILIADRYLPDRSVNIISQRYSKLCVMLYKANGIQIDSKGNLEEPPKLESIDDINEARVKELELGIVEPPAILNVHRWSLEEDLTLLKAVPITGNMWAELRARLMPHRDRGHIRKRYQVLERRVKATIARSSKSESTFKGQRSQASKKEKTSLEQKKAATATAHTLSKSGTTKATPSVTTSNGTAGPAPTPMTIANAAASLTGLHPQGEDASSKRDSKPSASDDHDIIRRPAAAATRDESEKFAIPDVRPPLSPLKTSRFSTPRKDNKPFTSLGTSTPSRFLDRLDIGTGDEWSQLSGIKRMFENDTESHAAHATPNRLPKSPLHLTGTSSLPHIHMESNLSGLSFFQSDMSKHSTTAPDQEKTSTPSDSRLLARVLEGSTTRLGSKDNNDKPLIQSPRKRQAVPSTPSTPKHTQFFAPTGTPIGFSPGFRPSPTSMRNTASLALTPNAPFSPAPSAMMRMMTDNDGDDVQFCDFQISEASRNQIEVGDAAAEHDPNPPPLTPSKSSLLGDMDMEAAVSALKTLSNSPFRQPNPPEAAEEKPKGRKSLFETVVGGIKGKDPKAKLQF